MGNKNPLITRTHKQIKKNKEEKKRKKNDGKDTLSFLKM